MRQFSRQWLTSVALLYAPTHEDLTLGSGMCDYVAVGSPPTEFPCRVISQMVGNSPSVMGMVPTGKSVLLLEPTVTIGANWKVMVDGVSYIVDLKPEVFTTHIEATLTPAPAG